MWTAINTRLVFEIPAKRRPGKQERRGVWLASRVVAALCRCGEPPLVDHGERSTDYRPFGQQLPQLGDVGGDAPGLVAREQLGGRAASRLLLEIDVGTPCMH